MNLEKIKNTFDIVKGVFAILLFIGIIILYGFMLRDMGDRGFYNNYGFNLINSANALTYVPNVTTYQQFDNDLKDEIGDVDYNIRDGTAVYSSSTLGGTPPYLSRVLGTNASFDTTSSPYLSDSLTISFWFDRTADDSGGNYAYVLESECGANGTPVCASTYQVSYQVSLSNNDNKIHVVRGAATSTEIISASTYAVPTGLHFVVITYDHNTLFLRLYVDNVLEASGISGHTGFAAAQSSEGWIFGEDSNPGDHTTAYLSQLIFSSSTYSTSTRTALYNNSSGTTVCFTVDCATPPPPPPPPPPYASPTGATLNITSPTPSSTVTTNTFYVTSSYNFPNLQTDSQISFLKAVIYYRFYQSSTGNYVFNDFSNNTFLTTVSGTNSTNVLVPNGRWNLRAYIYSYTYDIILAETSTVYDINEVSGLVNLPSFYIPASSLNDILSTSTQNPTYFIGAGSDIIYNSSTYSSSSYEGCTETFLSSSGLFCSLRNFVVWAFRVSPSSTDFLIKQVSGIKTVFPASLMFNTAESIKTAFIEVSASTTPVIVFTYSNNNKPLVALGSSTAVEVQFGSSFKNTLFEFQKYAFWFAGFIGFLGLVLVLV